MSYFRKLIGRFLCWLGIHRWLTDYQDIPVTVMDRWMWKYHQYDSVMSEPVRRACFRCGHTEYLYERKWSDINGWNEKWATKEELDRVQQ